MDWTPIIEAITASVVGLAVIAMAVAITRLARHNRALGAEVRRLVEHNEALVEVADQRAEASRALAEETHRDRAAAIQPLLVLVDEPPLGIREQPWAAVRVRNVGNGSALNFVVWMRAGGGLYRSSGAESQGFSATLHLAAGDIFEPGPFRNMLYVGNTDGYLDPGMAVVGEDVAANLIAYCGDSSGNRYRFNLRTADPPDVWERGSDAPSWAGAWDPRLSGVARPQTEANPVLTSLPRRDLRQLVEALHDTLHSLQDAVAADQDVDLTGRAQRPHVTEHRSDFEASS
jgi:hypothetical protein